MTDRIAHLCNGDSTADGLSLADLPGDIRVWADALDQGPLLPVGSEAFRAARARFAVTAGWETNEAAAQAKLSGWDQSLAVLDAPGMEEVVLWYEHDLFDQLALCRVLFLASFTEARSAQLTMVSIDRHPEVPLFLGLGQLAPEQLAALWPRRTPIAKEAVEEAVATWIALTAADPRVLPYLMKRVRALPFLAGAIERHLEEFPDPSSGLGRSERQALASIGRGASTHAEVRQELHAIDPRYPLTDVQGRAVLETLTSHELISASPAGEALAITARGRQALAGAFDVVAELGVDRWRGGVQLSGRGPVWRWDGAARKLVLR